MLLFIFISASSLTLNVDADITNGIKLCLRCAEIVIVDVVAGIWDQLLSEIQFMNSCLQTFCHFLKFLNSLLWPVLIVIFEIEQTLV